MIDHNVFFGLTILQVICIDMLLSGDNAVVIAMACRNLPERQRRRGLVLGAATAIFFRIVFAAFLVFLLDVPYLKIIGGLLLFWIAVKLVLQEEEADTGRSGSAETLIKAIATVAIADAVMSLDNVIAVAAAADGSIPVLVFSLTVSMPIMIASSALVLALFRRFPLVVWVGATVLGWVAGQLLAGDPAVQALHTFPGNRAVIASSLLGAIFVLAAGLVLKGRSGVGSAEPAAVITTAADHDGSPPYEALRSNSRVPLSSGERSSLLVGVRQPAGPDVS